MSAHGHDFIGDIALDPGVMAEGRAAHKSHEPEPKSILLTGATGFLGSFLLRELLQRTTADLFCLVRASDETTAMARIERCLDEYGLRDDRFRGRVIPLPGDLGKPLLGFTPDQFDRVAHCVHAIYHCGARVNFTEPYSQVRHANALSMREICRMAAKHRVKPVHFISTVGTVVAGPADPEILPEAWVSDPALLDPGGYVRSKWVAEGILRVAGSRGIPTATYRIARISGHSRTGVVGRDDAFWHYVRACIEIGARPFPDAEANWAENLVPVDFVAKAIVHLALTRLADGTTYNLVAPSPVTFAAVLEYAHAVGYHMDVVPYSDWSHRLEAAAVANPVSMDTSVHAAVIMNHAVKPPRGRIPRELARGNLLRGLADTGINCPSGTELLLHYFEYFADSGFLPQPERSGQA